jgi:hypothetical protein
MYFKIKKFKKQCLIAINNKYERYQDFYSLFIETTSMISKNRIMISIFLI